MALNPNSYLQRCPVFTEGVAWRLVCRLKCRRQRNRYEARPLAATTGDEPEQPSLFDRVDARRAQAALCIH